MKYRMNTDYPTNRIKEHEMIYKGLARNRIYCAEGVLAALRSRPVA